MKPSIDEAKLTALNTANDLLDLKYGTTGTGPREAFDAKAMAWYLAEVLRDARMASGMTQCQLADRIGKKREYVAMIEKGRTDMQLSTFLMMSKAVGLRIRISNDTLSIPPPVKG